MDTLQTGLQPLREVRVSGERHVLDGLDFVRCPSHEEPALLELHVFFGHLEEVGGDRLPLVSQLPGDHRGGGACGRRGA